jgi:2-keto-4-pentenoate hydratase
MDRISAACEFLWELRLRLRPPVASLPDDRVPRSLAEGYAIQDQLVNRLLQHHGGRRIGYKIACTSRLAQTALGVDGPFFGTLLSHSTYNSGVTLPASDFTVRCTEAEFAFELAEDVPPGPCYSVESIQSFIGAVLPSIEIVDHRYQNWQAVGAPSLLADNAIHGAWVVGQPISCWRDFDYPNHPVKLMINEQHILTGTGAAVLGNPLVVVAWLATELPRYGRRLRRGDRITTGLTTDIYLAQPGDRLVADFGQIGQVEMRFD